MQNNNGGRLKKANGEVGDALFVSAKTARPKLRENQSA